MSTHTDTERLDFMAKHGLYVAEGGMSGGEWQVFESVPRFYDDGIVTRNAFLPTAREAIDYAIDHYLGNEDQVNDSGGT